MLRRFKGCVAALLMLATPAFAQWQTPLGTVPIGRGVGATGFGSIAPGADGYCLWSTSGTWNTVPCGAPSGNLPLGLGAGFGFGALAPGPDGNCVTSTGGTWAAVPCPSFATVYSYIRTRDFVRSVLPGSDGVCDGSTVVTTQIQAALTAAAGKSLLVEGLCALNAFVDAPANITILSYNKFFNGFVAAAGFSPSAGLLRVYNHAGGVTIDNVALYGNATAASAGNTAGAIEFNIDSSSHVDMNNLTVKNSYFAGFKQSYWVWVVHSSQIGNVQNFNNLNFSDNTFVSSNGDANASASSFIQITANLSIVPPTSTGIVKNVLITRNYGLGLGVAGMAQTIGGVNDVVMSHNTTEAMGNSVDPLMTSYTYMAYESAAANTPHNISISNNVGATHHNLAAYCAGAYNCNITGNAFSGTFRPNSVVSLPWGAAIALNGCTDCSATGNQLRENYGGIYVATGSNPNNTSAGVNVSSNDITSSLIALPSAGQAPYGIIWGSDGTSTFTNEILTIGHNNIRMTGDVPSCFAYNGGSMPPVHANGNTCWSSSAGYTEQSSYLGGSRFFTNNTWTGTLANGPFITQSSSVPLNISGDIFDFSQVVAGSSSGVLVDANTKLNIQNATFRGKTNSGAAFSAVGAQGNIRNLSFPGVTSTQAAATSLGLAKPTFPAENGAWVDNLGKTEIGTAGSKYVVDHWINVSGSTTWQDQRQLTGN